MRTTFWSAVPSATKSWVRARAFSAEADLLNDIRLQLLVIDANEDLLTEDGAEE